MRNSGGNFDLPAGNPVTGGFITTTWANGTLADIAGGITDSLDRWGRGAMLAPLKLADGTAIEPALAFGTETNTGLFKAASNDVRVVVAGGEQQRWTAAGTVFAGTVTLDGSVTFDAATTFAALATLNAGLAVPGTSTLGTLSVTGNSALTGSATVGGTLAVTGATTLASATAASATVTGNATVGGTLGVTGATTLAGTTAGALVVTGVLTPSGGVSGPLAITSSAGPAVSGTGTADAQGGYFTNSATSASSAVEVWGNSASPAIFCNGTGGPALQVNSGHALFSGGNPAVTTGYANTLTPANIVKAWALLHTNGTGGVSITEGFNVASVSFTSGDIRVTFATPLASANFVAFVDRQLEGGSSYIRVRNTAFLDIGGGFFTGQVWDVFVFVIGMQ